MYAQNTAPADNSSLMSDQAQVHAAAVAIGTRPQLQVPAPTSDMLSARRRATNSHMLPCLNPNQINGTPYSDMAYISYDPNTHCSTMGAMPVSNDSNDTSLSHLTLPSCSKTSSPWPEMPLAVRIAFFTTEYAQNYDMMAYYHHHSAELERKRLDDLSAMTDFLEIVAATINEMYDDQHRKLIDDLEKCMREKQSQLWNMANSRLGPGCSSSNPGMKGNVYQHTSSTAALSAPPVVQQQGQYAPFDVSTDQDFQAMPYLPHTANKPATVSQKNGIQDINLEPIPRVRTEVREINELDTRILAYWYEKNYDFAYPLPQSYDILVQATGLHKWQVDKWFNNKRSRDKNTKKFPEIVKGRKARMKRGAAWLKHQDDQLKYDIMQIKANYSNEKKIQRR